MAAGDASRKFVPRSVYLPVSWPRPTAARPASRISRVDGWRLTLVMGPKRFDRVTPGHDRAGPRGRTGAKPKSSRALPRTESDMAKTKKAAATKAGDTGKGRASMRPPAAGKAGGGKGRSGRKGRGRWNKRKLGLRGAAPWAARHAAKHAAEARARAAEPPLPGQRPRDDPHARKMRRTSSSRSAIFTRLSRRSKAFERTCQERSSTSASS